MKLAAAFLFLLGTPDPGIPDLGHYEVDGTLDDFLRDVRVGRTDAAYARTSSAFRSYVSREDFPAYLKGWRELLAGTTLTCGKVREGKNCRQEPRTLLDVGVCFKGEQFRTLVFAWESGAWKYDHEAGG